MSVKVITVGIADCQVSNDPDATLVTHALGSCIAVAIYDPTTGVAGLLHFMLPESALDQDKGKRQPFMFADTGLPKLFHAAYALGGDKKRLTVRLVGGAQVMDPNGIFNIGKRNYLACRKILWAAGVMIHGEAVGGNTSRSVRLQVASGELMWTDGTGQQQAMVAGKKRGN